MWLPPYLLLLLCTAGLTLGEEDGAEGQGKGEATREGEGGEDFLKEPMVIAFASGVLVIICLIGLYGLSRFQERTGWSWPTPSCVTMCIGIAVGGLARWWGISEDGDAFTFNDDVFSAIVLPIVFMNFGYNSRVRFLRLNIGSTLFFALGSTLLCLFLFTTILFLVIKQVSLEEHRETGQLGETGQLFVFCLFVGSVVCAIEPDTLLDTMYEAYRMEESSVEPLLYTFLMFEMIISCACMVDSVHVILWSIDTFSATAELGWLNILLHWAWHLTLTLFLGIVVGLTAGVLVTLYFRWLSHRAAEYKYLEAGMLLIVPFVVYWGCEVINKAQATVQVSGIIAIYITALFMGNLAWKNLSAGARYHHQVILGALGLLVATYNFALLGSSLYFVVSQGSWNWQLIWTVLGVAYTVRLAVLPVGMLLTHWHRGTPLDYHIYYPKECLPPLSTEETEELVRTFAKAKDADSTFLTIEQLQGVLQVMGHTVTRDQVVGLMTVVDDHKIAELSLSEFLDLFTRTGYHRHTQHVVNGWKARTCAALYWAGQRGHIAFGAAFLTLDSAGDARSWFQGPRGKDFMLPCAWSLLAFGVILQGSLAPLLLRVLRLVPPEAEAEAEAEGQRDGRRPATHARRGWLMRLLLVPDQMATRHTFFNHAVLQVTQTDRTCDQERARAAQEEARRLEGVLARGDCDAPGGPRAPSAPADVAERLDLQAAPGAEPPVGLQPVEMEAKGAGAGEEGGPAW